jgi:hypothetical protein
MVIESGYCSLGNGWADTRLLGTQHCCVLQPVVRSDETCICGDRSC